MVIARLIEALRVKRVMRLAAADAAAGADDGGGERVH